MKKPVDIFDSLESCLAFSSKDWSLSKRDAWMYGIISGWDDDGMEDVSARHGWLPEDVERLRELHEQFKLLKEAFSEKPCSEKTINDQDKKDLSLLYNYILEMRGLADHSDEADETIRRICNRHMPRSKK